MTTTSPRFEDIHVGDPLPEFVTTVGRAQMFLFSAATNNAHRIHYDRTWAVDVEGLPDVVVHGPLHGALMARSVMDWLGPQARMTTHALKHMKPAFPGDEIHFQGKVTATRVDGGYGMVEVEIRETNGGGDVLGAGRISAALPLKAGD